MNKQQKSDRLLSVSDREKVIKEIIAFFQEERNEEIGVIAAETVLDFLLETAGEAIYKNTLTTVRKLIDANRGDLDLELDSLLEE